MIGTPSALSTPARPLIECREVVKHFPIPHSKEKVQAVNGVSIQVQQGETLGLVGESGSGKTTVGKMLLGLHRPSGGEIEYRGEALHSLTSKDFRRFRPKIQAVFQDPFDSLDPRMKVRDVIAEPLQRMGLYGGAQERSARVAEVAALVRLSDRNLGQYPHQLSGGQQQKVGVARALASSPEFVVLDEPTSALSPVARAELINILAELQQRLNVAYLFISHDLKAVERIADRIAVMYLGRIVEEGTVQEVAGSGVHPYTQALMASVLPSEPGSRARVRVLEGEIPSPIDLPPGCAFASRCPLALPECLERIPPLLPVEGRGQEIACIRPKEAEEQRRERAEARASLPA